MAAKRWAVSFRRLTEGIPRLRGMWVRLTMALGVCFSAEYFKPAYPQRMAYAPAYAIAHCRCNKRLPYWSTAAR